MFELISEGASFRAACRQLGLHNPTTMELIDSNDDWREQYARAKDLRAEFFQEEALTLGRAASIGAEVNVGAEGKKKIDPAGLRVYLDAIKWAAARMAPKAAPIQRVSHSFEEMAPDERAKRIAELTAKRNGDDPSDDEPTD